MNIRELPNDYFFRYVFPYISKLENNPIPNNYFYDVLNIEYEMNRILNGTASIDACDLIIKHMIQEDCSALDMVNKFPKMFNMVNGLLVCKEEGK